MSITPWRRILFGHISLQRIKTQASHAGYVCDAFRILLCTFRLEYGILFSISKRSHRIRHCRRITAPQLISLWSPRQRRKSRSGIIELRPIVRQLCWCGNYKMCVSLSCLAYIYVWAQSWCHNAQTFNIHDNNWIVLPLQCWRFAIILNGSVFDLIKLICIYIVSSLFKLVNEKIEHSAGWSLSLALFLSTVFKYFSFSAIYVGGNPSHPLGIFERDAQTMYTNRNVSSLENRLAEIPFHDRNTNQIASAGSASRPPLTSHICSTPPRSFCLRFTYTRSTIYMLTTI